MRRSICCVEPSFAYAGQVATWKFIHTTSVPLPKGTRLKFDLLVQGRAHDWQVPSTHLKEKRNLIWMELADHKAIPAQRCTLPSPFAAAFEFTLPADLEVGEALTILMGGVGTAADQGTRAQIYVQRRRPFHLYIDPRGKGDYRDPEIFCIDVKGAALHTIRITTPSIVSKNRRFDVQIRFEDRFGNLTNNAPSGALIELSYEHLRENLNWKLFVPEAGFLNLPNLYFNEAGIYRIQLLNSATKESFLSAPMKCFAETEKNIYWGLLHGESEKADAKENIDSCLRYFRDEKGLHFFAISAFESIEETSNDAWRHISTQIAELNEESRFTTFLGMQWLSQEAPQGLRHLIYTKDNKPILRATDQKLGNLQKIYKSHHPKELLSVPCFTMASSCPTPFDACMPDYERVVEIYNAWGSSECSEKEGNPRPISFRGKKGVAESAKGSIRKALNAGHRFGFVAGGLDDRGVYSDLYNSDQVQYSPGLTAIIAPDQRRETLMHALYQRSCYATTGEKILLGFSLAGSSMGGELNTKAKPGLAFNRHLTGYAAGTKRLKEVCIFRNGKLLHTIHPRDYHAEFAFDDTDPLSSILLPGGENHIPFVYYYLRVLQEDEHLAWSSPIWIDGVEIPAISPFKRTAKAQ